MKSLEGTFFASYHTSDSGNDRSRNSSDNISFTPSLLLILLFSQYFHNEIMLRCYTCLQSLIVSNPWLFHSNETVDLHRELFHSNPWLGSNCAQHEPPWTILLPATSNTIITSTTGCIIFTQSPHSIFDVLIHSLLRSAVQSNRKRKGALDSAPAEAPKKKRRKKKRRKKKGPRKCNIRRRDDLPATNESHTDIPLSERDIEKVREWAYNEAGLIYMVKANITRRGDADAGIRNEYEYVGRFYNGRGDEKLETDWLDENYMDADWRRSTILRNPGHWYRVPVSASDKQSSVKQSSKKSACIADCLIKFFDHVGLTRFSEAFKEVRHLSPQWKRCRSIIKKFKKFGHRYNINIDPLRSSLANDVLYLFQLRSVHTDTGDVDNSHAVCVFNGLVYDANIDNPLPVNRPNLDKCCVGGTSWVFDEAVRSAMFNPNPRTASFIQKHLQKNQNK